MVRGGFCSQKATVLEEYITEEQRSVMRFLWAKELTARDINKYIFPVYIGECLLHKADHNCFEKFSQGRSKVADGVTEVWNWLKQQSEDFCAAGFDALGKSMGQMYRC
jgi:hypothetical protein